MTVPSFLSVVESANSFSLEQERQVLNNPGPTVGLPLFIQGTLVGLIPPVSVPHLEKFPKVFVMGATAVHISDSFETLDARSEAVATVLAELRAQAVFSCLKGWRNEEYPIFGRPGQGILLRIERSAAGVLGVRAAGCHLNAYLRDAEGHLKMWISRRSFTKQTYPGMLDNTAGGEISCKV
jgi:hypothetical protein